MADPDPNSSSESAMGWAILAVIFGIFAVIAWGFFEYQIKDGIRWIRYGEMKLVSFFVDDEYTVSFTDSTGKTINLNYKRDINAIPKIRASCDDVPEQYQEKLMYCLNSDTMNLIGKLSLHPLRYPVIALFVFWAFWAYSYGPRAKHRRKLTLDGLIINQAKIFPVISPFQRFNPSDQPPRPPGAPVPAELPLFAEALGPEEWLAYYKIPIDEKGKINEAVACREFARQLGAPWRGAARLEPYKQVLLAAFCLKAARKRSQADDMLGALARCWDADKGLRLDKNLVKEAQHALRNKDISGETLAICNQHAYQATALMRALLRSREEGGVLSPSQFVWLRGHDRELWYPLNNLGRQSFHMEALGAMSHFKQEKLVGRPIPVPKVQDAYTSIQQYMSSVKARPIPQLSYDSYKGKSVKMPASSAVKKAKK